MKFYLNTLEEKQEALINLIGRIYKEENGKKYIGGEEIKPDILSLLKDQAQYIETSQFYEILNATIINEAFNLGVLQSKDFDSVQFAKALVYANNIIKKMIKGLSK